MKLKTRLIVAFLTIIIIPILLSAGVITVLTHLQLNTIERNYGVSGTSVVSLSNTTEMLARLIERPYNELTIVIEEDPAEMDDEDYLESFNESIGENDAYLIVRKGDQIVFQGSEAENADSVVEELPEYGSSDPDAENALYLGGDAASLVRQIDFLYPDGSEGSAFVVRSALSMVPEVSQLITRMMIGIVVALIVTATFLIWWIYRGIVRPLSKMREAARNIQEGNLDFELKPEADDELGELAESLEDMRKRLKDDANEKVEFDQENKDLISNISHDLRTPVTAIKGYAEGIMDGVADTPDKMAKYVQTIYNKANEMDQLINELTLYSRIDTNRIPYNFAILSVQEYFNDCAEDLSLELESRNVQFEYFNSVSSDVQIIADAEQIKRVIHNIINNSLKYMDKDKPRIALRVKDVGDFIQVEVEDNGKGISAKDLPNIFDRFYRTDSSRNSSLGGSGIGLSVVKKIIEEHGGKVWAASQEGKGTTLYFVLRKYQEVPANE